MRYRWAIQKRDWERARSLMYAIGEAAISGNSPRLLAEMHLAAARFGDHVLAIEWAVVHARSVGWIGATTWTGQDLRGKTLEISFKESLNDGLSSGMNLAGWVERVAERSAQCTLIADARMVPIYQRTLPNVRVLPFSSKSPADARAPDFTANKLTLRSGTGVTDATMAALFKPLKADERKALQIRDKYRGTSQKLLLGISWYSGHHDKDLPSPEDWGRLLSGFDATFVNLNYREGHPETHLLMPGQSEFRMIQDPSIDQFKDMDDFAAQLCALDLVISISNTGAHLAASLGIPPLVVRDDRFTRGWPVLTSSTPWYPSVTVFGREGRTWAEVFDSLRTWLESTRRAQSA